MDHFQQSGQTRCYDSSGQEMPCQKSGQDGDYSSGAPWPPVRFDLREEGVVRDNLTGFFWTRNANINGFPVSWQEALDLINRLNQEEYSGFSDWRLPNRRELRSLMDYQTRKPALPLGHPFQNIFLGWYWSSTTAAIHPAYAWYVHLEGARMFYGRKDQYSLFWPVRGTGNGLLAATGQNQCFDALGSEIPCRESGQDGEVQMGAPWPQPKFSGDKYLVSDNVTNLIWSKQADITRGPVTWNEALQTIRAINRYCYGGISQWRLPNINELESLVDCRYHSPALSIDHLFTGLQDGYWSATTSFFETDWAWVLYLNKGACGVGHKPGKTFYVWPVATGKTAEDQ